uniref:Uncharacterized protein n=1 Tax=Glossina palpalis gambiensis TaxID=67801 RepID=A0A1B0AMC8_9MUSC
MLKTGGGFSLRLNKASKLLSFFFESSPLMATSLSSKFRSSFKSINSLPLSRRAANAAAIFSGFSPNNFNLLPLHMLPSSVILKKFSLLVLVVAVDSEPLGVVLLDEETAA